MHDRVVDKSDRITSPCCAELVDWLAWASLDRAEHR
jgi:hypothetical protein